MGRRRANPHAVCVAGIVLHDLDRYDVELRATPKGVGQARSAWGYRAVAIVSYTRRHAEHR